MNTIELNFFQGILMSIGTLTLIVASYLGVHYLIQMIVKEVLCDYGFQSRLQYLEGKEKERQSAKTIK